MTVTGLRLPELITVTCLQDGCPTEGRWISVTLPVRVKNEYGFIFGPSDAKGRITIDREALLAEAKETERTGLMDYAGLEGNWTGSLQIAALDVDGVDRALEAHAVWSAAGIRFPPDYVSSLTRLRRVLVDEPVPASLRVELMPAGAANLVVRA